MGWSRLLRPLDSEGCTPSRMRSSRQKGGDPCRRHPKNRAPRARRCRMCSSRRHRGNRSRRRPRPRRTREARSPYTCRTSSQRPAGRFQRSRWGPRSQIPRGTSSALWRRRRRDSTRTGRCSSHHRYRTVRSPPTRRLVRHPRARHPRRHLTSCRCYRRSCCPTSCRYCCRSYSRNCSPKSCRCCSQSSPNRCRRHSQSCRSYLRNRRPSPIHSRHRRPMRRSRRLSGEERCHRNRRQPSSRAQ
jgi:hypothetical protein